MNNKNLWRIIWVVGIYAVLVLILFLVIRYKVRWEDKDPNRYLYIYDCGDTICSTESKIDTYIASIACDGKDCPYIKGMHNKDIILASDKKGYIYNLQKKQVINDSYINYLFTQNDDAYIAINSDNKYGIIDNEGNTLVEFTYDKIIDYKDGFILYQVNDKMGIDIIDSDVKIPANYDKLALFNDKLYIYSENNEYYVASYATMEPVNTSIYNYIYPYKDILLVSINNQIDILDHNLKSKLIMKINSYYPYTKGEERVSLNPKGIGNMLKFTVVLDEDNYIDYIYDIKNGKLYS